MKNNVFSSFEKLNELSERLKGKTQKNQNSVTQKKADSKNQETARPSKKKSSKPPKPRSKTTKKKTRLKKNKNVAKKHNKRTRYIPPSWNGLDLISPESEKKNNSPSCPENAYQKFHIPEGYNISESLLVNVENGIGAYEKIQDTNPIENDEGITIHIGLDFGTSFTKVVLQDESNKDAWVVPFNEQKEPYLLPTSIYLDEEKKAYNLLRNGKKISNLKTPFLQGQITEDQYCAILAYLSLVISHSKNWLVNSKQFSKDDTFQFLLNIGLPAATLENSWLKEKYTQLAMEALLLSKQVCNSFISLLDIKSGIGNKQFEDYVIVYPEIVAQHYAYTNTNQWDRKKPLFMIIDIGGGTLDGVCMNIVEHNGDRTSHLLSSSLENYGVRFLHQNRLLWLSKEIDGSVLASRFKDALDQERHFQSIAPFEPKEYTYPQLTSLNESSIDDEFKKKIFQFIGGLYKKAKDNNPNSEQWHSIPIILCGGGKNYSIYTKTILNDYPRILGQNHKFDGFKTISLTPPEKLFLEENKKVDFHRYSVAYGLSCIYDKDYRLLADLPEFGTHNNSLLRSYGQYQGN